MQAIFNQPEDSIANIVAQALQHTYGSVPFMSVNAERQTALILKAFTTGKTLSKKPARLLERLRFVQRNSTLLGKKEIRAYKVPATIFVYFPNVNWIQGVVQNSPTLSKTEKVSIVKVIKAAAGAGVFDENVGTSGDFTSSTDTAITATPELTGITGQLNSGLEQEDAQLKPRMLSSLISLNDEHFFTENAMGEMFSTSRQNINSHLRDLMNEGEVASSQITVVEKVSNNRKYQVRAFDKHAAYAVALRVRSETAKEFRKALIQLGIDFEKHGIVVDQKRASEGDSELFEKVEQLSKYMVQRADAKLLHEKIANYFESSIDWDILTYDEQGIFKARTFNCLYFVTHGKSAQGIIQESFDPTAPNCGLQFIPDHLDYIHESTCMNALSYFTPRRMGKLIRSASIISNLVTNKVEDREDEGLPQPTSANIMKIILECTSFTAGKDYSKSYISKASTRELIRKSKGWGYNRNRQVTRENLIK